MTGEDEEDYCSRLGCQDRSDDGQECVGPCEAAARARERRRPFPGPSAPKHTPAGLKPMIDLMQRARDRETYGGATDD